MATRLGFRERDVAHSGIFHRRLRDDDGTNETSCFGLAHARGPWRHRRRGGGRTMAEDRRSACQFLVLVARGEDERGRPERARRERSLELPREQTLRGLAEGSLKRPVPV